MSRETEKIRIGLIVDEKWYTPFFLEFARLLSEAGPVDPTLIMCMDSAPDPESAFPFVRFSEETGRKPKGHYAIKEWIGYERSLAQFDAYFEGRHREAAESISAQVEEWLASKPVDCLVVWSGTRLASRTVAETARHNGYPLVSLETPYFQELPEPPETDFVMDLHRMKNKVFIADIIRAPQTGPSQLARDWAKAAVWPGLEDFLKRIHEKRVSKFSQADIKRFLSGKADAEVDESAGPDPEVELFRPPGMKALLVLGQVDRDSSMYFGDHLAKGWRDLGIALAERLPPGWIMWFKGHPLDRNYAKGVEDFAHEIHAINPRCKVLPTTIDIHLCFQHCDAVASINSTATIEAATYGLPVVNLGHGSFTHIGMTHTVASLDEVEAAIAGLPERMTPEQYAIRDRFLSYVLYDYLIPVGSPRKMLDRIRQAIDEAARGKGPAHGK